MFGGNATERRRRNDRIWTGVLCIAVALAAWWWITDVEDATPGQMKLFWVIVVLFAALGGVLAWCYADAEAGGPVGVTLTLAAVGSILSNLLEDFIWFDPILFGMVGGFMLGGGIASLAIVFVRPFLASPATTEQGDSPAS